MPRFLKDRAETIERLRELHTSLMYAEYELGAAVMLAKSLGMTWDELAAALGQGSKAAASQWAKRRNLSLDGITDDELDRLGKLIGVGERVSRWQVRVIVEGKPGVSRVRRETLSTHLKREVAEERCRRRGPDAELWQVDPDGTERQVNIRPAGYRGASRKAVAPYVPADGDEAF